MLDSIWSNSRSYKHVSDPSILDIDVILHQDPDTIFSSSQQQMLKGLQKTLRQPYNTVFSYRPRLRSPCLTLINHTVRMSSSEEPTTEGARVLFQKLEQKFPSKTLGRERWYLVAVRLSSDPSKLHVLIPIRSPPSQEVVNPSLPVICTPILSKVRTMLLQRPDRP